MGKGKRSIDKEMITIHQAITNTNSNFNIFPSSGGVTFPCTISSVRAVGSVSNAGTLATPAQHYWSVCLQREGETMGVPTLPASAATPSTVQTPEEDIMIFGKGITYFNSTASSAWAVPRHYEVVGTTKRKLMIGDKLVWTAVAAPASQAVDFDFVLQFFVMV
jgi:hypothetical protein